MIYEIENFLIVICEMFCCKIFYETFGKVRYKGWINTIQFLSMVFCTRLVIHELSAHFVLKQIVIIILYAVFMLWHINISAKKSIILGILYQALLLTIDYLSYSINNKWFLKSELTESQYIMENMLVILLGKAILFLCIFIIRKQFGKKTSDMLIDIEWLKFLFFPVFTIAIISAMLDVFEYVATTKQANLLFIIAFGMIGMNIVVFYLIHDIIYREIKLHENQVFQLQVKNQTDMYRSISENLDKQKRKTHEFRNQIVCIESLLTKKKYEQCENYVKNIYSDLNEETDVINTNHVIVNAILNTKYQEMTDKGIVFVFRVNDLSKINIRDEDVVTILANLLNNAIEACEECVNKKIIKLKFVCEEDKVIISVKNSYSHPILYDHGEIVTSKTIEPEDHGIGIKNIVSVIDRYNGSYVIKESGTEFYFSIVFPLNEIG